MYPIVVRMSGRRAVVIGGGAVGERKVCGLLDAAADVVLVSPAATPGLIELAAQGRVRWQRRTFAPEDLEGAFLAVAATPDEAVNAAIVAQARATGILVNDARDPGRGDFATPAVHRSGSLTVAVDSTGQAPAFARRIRDELAVVFDTRYAAALTTLDRLRGRVQAVVPPAGRAAVMRHLSERDIDDLAGMPPGELEHEVERAVDTIAQVIPAQPRTLVCASRASALAMVQTRAMMAQLALAGIASTVLNVTTRGDAVQDRALAAIGGDSLFVKELENALRDGRADYAVHSCKDLPSTLADDFTIAAITRREDPRDAFCSERHAGFRALPPGARVGTSSPRRRAQLHALRPDLTYVDIRGNVDTRLRKLRAGDYDAIVLACAGLRRLGVGATHTVPFAPDELTPAVGQGALAIETRRDDPHIAPIAAALGDPVTDLCVRAERAYLRTLRGGCQAPVGAHATYADGVLRLIAVIAALDGSRIVRGARYRELTPDQVDAVAAAEALGTDLARELLAAGGEAILSANAPPLAGQLVLVGGGDGEPARIAAALREAGAEVVEARDAQSARAGLAGRLPGAILLSSAEAVDALADYLGELLARDDRPVVAALGSATAGRTAALGFPADLAAPDAEVGPFVHTVTRYLLEHHR